MKECDYFDKWKLISERFDRWFDGGKRWTLQQRYLTTQLKKEFNLSSASIRIIFSAFNNIYSDYDPIPFDWEKYQLPTLIALVAKHVKIQL